MKLKRDIIHSMLRRCENWDYKKPWIYQITLILADRASNSLGKLVDINSENPKVELSEIGKIVLNEWLSISTHHPEVKPLFMQVMPDHVHGIIRVLKPLPKPLGNIIGGFKTGSSKAATGTTGLWAKGFQDTILFNEGQLDKMFNYLRDNPRRLAIKRLNPNLFKVRRKVSINLALPRQEQNIIRESANNKASKLNIGDISRATLRSVSNAEALPLSAYFSAIGNLKLLDSPNIIQVQCSRSYFAYKRISKPGGGYKIAKNSSNLPIIERITPQFEELRDSLLSAAKRGATLISPSISDGEREIARLAYEAQVKIIVLKNMGFSPLYKPGGKLFDKTANGKLLLLSPIAWPYAPKEKPITRLDACILNRIAQLISGEGAATINYKGYRPLDIDRFLVKAVSPLKENYPKIS